MMVTHAPVQGVESMGGALEMGAQVVQLRHGSAAGAAASANVDLQLTTLLDAIHISLEPLVVAVGLFPFRHQGPFQLLPKLHHYSESNNTSVTKLYCHKYVDLNISVNLCATQIDDQSEQLLPSTLISFLRLLQLIFAALAHGLQLNTYNIIIQMLRKEMETGLKNMGVIGGMSNRLLSRALVD